MSGHIGRSSSTRLRWAAIGAAVAVSLGAGGIGLITHAAGSSAASSFVSITPCRLFDTRPAPDNVGDRNTPLNAGEELLRQVTGANGNCAIPGTATAISYNLTIPTGLNGFLTIYPADASRPKSSNVNPVAGEGVKANGGTVGLSAAGAIKVYTLTGPVHALLDITGYFLPAGGPPDGYVSHRGGSIASTEADSAVTQLVLPAGSFAVSAKLYGFASATGGSHNILCSLTSGANQLDFTHSTSDISEYRNLALQGMVTLANPGTVSLVCSAQALDSLTTPAYQLYGVTLTAIAVTLHDQSPV